MRSKKKKEFIPFNLRTGRKKPGPKRSPMKGKKYHENEKVPLKPVKTDTLTEGLE